MTGFDKFGFPALAIMGLMNLGCDSASDPREKASARPGRDVWFNGKRLDGESLRKLESLERTQGVRVPDGRFWYDNACGAVGLWGGPTAGFILSGLELGGPLPSDCSTGGTGVFINGREIHPLEVAYLQQLVGQVWPARYWLDAFGNAGREGQPGSVNLVQLARMQQARAGRKGGVGGGWSHSMNHGGDRSHVGGDDSFLYFMDSKGNNVYIDR